MGKSSGSARETGHKFPDDLDYEKKTTHFGNRKWDATSYRTKDYSDPEMIISENRSEIGQNFTFNKHSNAKSQRSLSSLSRIGSSPVQFGRVADELTTINDIMTGVRNEVDAYSKLERRYVHELEKKLPKSEGMGDIRMHMTVDQLEKIRSYRRNALDQLTEMNEKIAALEARVERIAYEADEAELNSKLQELEALYCISEPEPEPSITYTTEITAPAPRIEHPTKSHKVAETPVVKRQQEVVNRVPEAAPEPSITYTTEITAPAPRIEATVEKTIVNQGPDNSKIAKVVQSKQAEIMSELQTIGPATQMPNRQVQALRQLLGEYKKNHDPLSNSATDKSNGNDNATTFVDASAGAVMEQQLLQEPTSETIEDLLREHAQRKRTFPIAALNGVLKLPSKLPINIHKKKKVLIAGGAGASVATGAWILESRTGMLSHAVSNIMRMLG